MLDINHILESIIGLTTASILFKLLDKLIEKVFEHYSVRALEQEDEESANKNINDFISSHYNPNYFNISATNSATM